MLKCRLEGACDSDSCCLGCQQQEKWHCLGCDYLDEYEFGCDCPYSYEDPEEQDEE